MIAALLSSAFAFLAKQGFAGLADRGIAILERRAELAGDRDKARYQFAAESLRQTVEETRIMADFNRAKFEFPWFWLMVALFVVPLGVWWAAVLLDSVGNFAWDVADLPTPEIRQWAGDMIHWLFYTGSAYGLIKAGKRALTK